MSSGKVELIRTKARNIAEKSGPLTVVASHSIYCAGYLRQILDLPSVEASNQCLISGGEYVCANTFNGPSKLLRRVGIQKARCTEGTRTFTHRARIKQVPERACDGAVLEFSSAEDGCAAAERRVGDQAEYKAVPVDDGPCGRGDAAGEGGRAALSAGGDGGAASDQRAAGGRRRLRRHGHALGQARGADRAGLRQVRVRRSAPAEDLGYLVALVVGSKLLPQA
jgi:hypothetical protein